MTDNIDNFIRGLGDAMSAVETASAEAKCPQPAITTEDPVKRAVIEMLTESTGCHILDSGGSFGRHWQHNRAITTIADWDDSAPETWKFEKWGDRVNYEHSINIYHYLVENLSITEASQQKQREFDEYCEARPKDSYYQLMEKFSNLEAHSPEWSENTYNGDCDLSQGLQFNIFSDEDGDCFILLQVHNGADIRGGYTDPRVFEVDPDDFTSFGHGSLYQAPCGHWTFDPQDSDHACIDIDAIIEHTWKGWRKTARARMERKFGRHPTLDDVITFNDDGEPTCVFCKAEVNVP